MKLRAHGVACERGGCRILGQKSMRGGGYGGEGGCGGEEGSAGGEGGIGLHELSFPIQNGCV